MKRIAVTLVNIAFLICMSSCTASIDPKPSATPPDEIVNQDTNDDVLPTDAEEPADGPTVELKPIYALDELPSSMFSEEELEYLNVGFNSLEERYPDDRFYFVGIFNKYYDSDTDEVPVPRGTLNVALSSDALAEIYLAHQNDKSFVNVNTAETFLQSLWRFREFSNLSHDYSQEYLDKYMGTDITDNPYIFTLEINDDGKLADNYISKVKRIEIDSFLEKSITEILSPSKPVVFATTLDSLPNEQNEYLTLGTKVEAYFNRYSYIPMNFEKLGVEVVVYYQKEREIQDALSRLTEWLYIQEDSFPIKGNAYVAYYFVPEGTDLSFLNEKRRINEGIYDINSYIEGKVDYYKVGCNMMLGISIYDSVNNCNSRWSDDTQSFEKIQ